MPKKSKSKSNKGNLPAESTTLIREPTAVSAPSILPEPIAVSAASILPELAAIKLPTKIDMPEPPLDTPVGAHPLEYVNALDKNINWLYWYSDKCAHLRNILGQFLAFKTSLSATADKTLLRQQFEELVKKYTDTVELPLLK